VLPGRAKVPNAIVTIQAKDGTATARFGPSAEREEGLRALAPKMIADHSINLQRRRVV
jgi:hypothetical protein